MNFLFGAKISCPLSILQRVHIIEVIFTTNVWVFSQDQVNCRYQRGVLIREVSVLERCPYQRGVRKERFYYIFLTQGEIQCHDFQPQRRIQYSQNDETSCENAGYNYPIPMLKKDFVSNSNWTKSSTIQGYFEITNTISV